MKKDLHTRDLHTRISMRPNLVAAITKAAIINQKNVTTNTFRLIAGLRANKMVLSLFN